MKERSEETDWTGDLISLFHQTFLSFSETFPRSLKHFFFKIGRLNACRLICLRHQRQSFHCDFEQFLTETEV